jgi:hypothetical protein
MVLPIASDTIEAILKKNTKNNMHLKRKMGDFLLSENDKTP